MKYKAVIFDLDGTLLDTLGDIGSSVNRVLENKGFPVHPLERYRQFVGEGSKQLVTRALPAAERNKEQIDQCLAAFFDDYNRNWHQLTTVYDGITDLLGYLDGHRLKTAVLSNKRHDLTKKCIGYFFPDHHFDAVFGLRPSVPRKPHPAGALEIGERLSVSPRKILYVGDSGTDMETAVGADMFPVGVLWGFRLREELSEKGAKKTIDHPLKLVDLLIS